MSKAIDDGKPLSDFDRNYLAQRGQWYKIAEIDEKHGTGKKGKAQLPADPTQEVAGDTSKGSGTGDVDPASDEARQASENDTVWVESLTVPQLKDVIVRMDADADQKVLGKMNKPDLQAELLAILEEGDEDNA